MTRKRGFGCACGLGQSETIRRGQEKHAESLKIGDRVRYSRLFLRSTGSYTGDLPFAKGKIVGFTPLGPETKLADIAWENCDCPPRVNVFNLSKVGRLEPE